MKNSPGKKAALFMIMLLILTPLLWLQGDSIALAATPTFNEKKVEIIGEDETYQLDIKDKVAGSSYKWSSSNTKVARVSSKGLVTTVGKGTAKIRCIVTLPNKKTKTLTSNITVIVPATQVRINNATEVNGAHILQVGDTYNFNRDITPSGSSDKTYWSLVGGDKSCLVVTNSSSGIVRAEKPGKVILMATAARTATEADAAKSYVNDAIIIEVVGPSATVGKVDIVDSTVIKAVFDSPIDERTIIGQNNSLLDSIDISLKKNIKGVLAADPGKITAQLSSDKKTLTITSTNRFEGEYGINFTDKIKTTGGVPITDYYKLISYVDTVGPDLLEVKLDDSGMNVSIIFTEAVDFSGLRVTGGGLVPIPGSSTTVDSVTRSILNNKNNYVPSEDKKSLTINLSNIAPNDFNKLLTVTISGIKDLSGNEPVNYTIPVVLQTDNTPKPQARLIGVTRTGYNTLTATFDRAIRFGGYATINNGVTMVGMVDEKDPKMVHYTMISEADAQRTGMQTISITGWQGAYNVNPNDTTSYQHHTRPVNFDVERSNPILLKDEFDPETSVLTLTYNREVTLSANTGTFNATVVSLSNEIRPNNNINYVKLASDDPKVIRLQMSNMTLIGNYSFTLDQYFVSDSFRNYALPRPISIDNSGGSSNEFPGPYLVTQSTTNPSEIYVEFMNMLDVASATDARNYSIPGVTILSARLEKNTKNDGSTVVLTVADGSINVTLERPLVINRITDYNGNYSPLVDHRTNVLLKDNMKPYFINPPIFDRNRPNEIKLTFSEEISGTMKVRVTQIGPYSYEIGNNVEVSGNSVVITLNSQPENNSSLKIDILENKIVDLSGNQSAPMVTQLMVRATY